MSEPTPRQAREALAYLLKEVRTAQGANGLLTRLQRAYHAGDLVAADRALRQTRDLLRVLEVMIETVQWPEEA